VDSVIRALVIYAVLTLLFRIAGKRTLAQSTPFDLVLLLIISEAVQNYLVGQDYSLTNVVLLVTTLIGADIALSFWKQRSERIARVLEDVPVVIVRDGQPIQERLRAVRVDESDILEAARKMQGLERMDQIKYAILERSGEISVIPKA
jgi:uncharacterized membrane protein YcaP (DUF421 family)